MKKIVFCLLLIFSIFFVACDSKKECKITFVNALNIVVEEYTIKKGDNIVYPTSEEMQTDGYRFLDSFDKNITIASNDETIKGNYVKTWIVNFYNESSELISTQVIDEGESAESPEINPKEGYTFKGWKIDFSNVTTNLEVYGDYDIVSYNLKYSSNVENSIKCNFDNDTEIALGTTIILRAKEIRGYNFLGFYENDTLITEDLEYTFEITEDRNISVKYAVVEMEIVVEDGILFAYFGSYPQTLLEDTSIINALKTLETDENGYVTYNGTTYCKTTASFFNSNSYPSLSGSTNMINGKEYYFIVEPIKWRIISTGTNSYELVTEYTIDAGEFYNNPTNDLSPREIDGKTVYANNYEYSTVRKYLNEAFFNLAFTELEQQIIKTTLVDNSSKTGLDFNKDMDPTAYACSDTLDKVYLLSYKDYLNKLVNKQSKATDYAIAKGCWIQQYTSDKYCTYWWFRTPNPAYKDVTHFDTCALIGDDEGGFDWNLTVYFTFVGYKPAITVAR